MAIPADELLAIFAVKQWRIDKTCLQSGGIGVYKRRGWQERRQTRFDGRITRVIDLERAMSMLPDEEKAALILAYGEKRRTGEVAVILGVSDRTVYNMLERARQHLANVLGRLGLL